MKNNFLSLIVCTRNRVFRLPGLFESLRRLDFPTDQWELILVNNASTDGTATLLDELINDFPAKATVHTEPQIGLSRARNLGISRAVGDLLIFIDDDCLPRFDFLQKIEVSFRTNLIDFLSGKILLKDPNDAPITINIGEKAIFLQPKQFVPAGFLKGANMAFKREVFESIGKFDESLGLGTSFPAEDVDFAMRASLSGFRGAYLPEPVVYHHHGRKPNSKELTITQKSYDLGRGAYFAKYLLNKKSFKLITIAYRKHLFDNISYQTLIRSYRELIGAIGYIVFNSFARK